MRKKYKPVVSDGISDVFVSHKRDHIVNDKKQEWKIISEAECRGKKIGEEEGKKYYD